MKSRSLLDSTHLLPLLLLCAWAIPVTGQQVVNGSFESLTALPSTTGQWNLLLVTWHRLENTPMHFTFKALAAETCRRLRSRWSPDQGMAIAGSWRWVPPGLTAGNTSHTFSQPLEPGATYRFTFRMTNGERTAFRRLASK